MKYFKYLIISKQELSIWSNKYLFYFMIYFKFKDILLYIFI